MLPVDLIAQGTWQEFDPPLVSFGETGQGNGQFLFPNVAIADSRDRIYLTDGNNGRISTWENSGEFIGNFGAGTGDGALSLPRGAWISSKDHLHVADAVGQHITVFDISDDEAEFLFVFGDLGFDDGYFQYPSDITMDSSGKLYVTDRENNRVQVWSY